MKQFFLFGILSSIIFLHVSGQGPVPMPPAYDTSVKVNFVRTFDVMAPITQPAELLKRQVSDVRMTTQYADGLGRPIQTVMKQGSMVTGGTAFDLVSPVVYDEFGRERYKYLPFAANSTGGNTSISDGLFKLNPFQQQEVFMQQQYDLQNEIYYYGQTNFESSPLNRVLEVFAAGNSWVGTADETNENDRRGIKAKYWVNTIADSVRIWTVTDVTNDFGTYSAAGGFYAPGELFKGVTVDEHGRQIIEFSDKEGLIILKKVQHTASEDDGTGRGYYGWLCTYYIYDEFNNLRCAVQPIGVQELVNSAWTFTATLLNELCFRYEYDYRKRLVMKKVPGAGEVYMVYDARDRLVLTQDANLREDSPKKWLYTQYDHLNRPVATGLWNNTNTRIYHSERADTSIAYPDLAGQTIEELTRTFYDDYNWRSQYGNPLSDELNTDNINLLLTTSNTSWPYPQSVTKSNRTNRLVTGTRAKVLGTPVTYLYSVNFYDDNGRLIQTQSSNVTGGTDIVTTQYSWNGQPLIIINKTTKNSPNTQTTVAVTKITYDDLWRPVKTEKKVSNSLVNSGNMPGNWTVISENEYDALSQLRKKILSPQGNLQGGPLDSLVYDYNIRGWVLGMNRAFVKDTNSTSDYFGFDLGYDKDTILINNANYFYSAKQYNGNITGMLWKSTGDNRVRKYDFTYDAVNRLTNAAFTQLTNITFNTSAGIDFSATGLTYDANGNILSMNQRGWKPGGSQTIDSLLYKYFDYSNRLKNVLDRKNDTATRLGDFRSSKAYIDALGTKTTTSTDYGYDDNGNMVMDLNKDISNGIHDAIAYNHLNLPQVIYVAGKGSIEYVYDAAGNKLKKIVHETNKPDKTTLYIVGCVYENDTLQFIAHDEGRIRFKQESNDLVYDYFIKDHLGNVRMVLTEEQQVDAYPAASMENVDNPNQPDYYIPYYYNTDYNQDEDVRYDIGNIPGYPQDEYTDPNQFVSRLNGGSRPIGPGIALKVMSGDKINVRVSSWYSNQEGQAEGEPLSTDALALLLAGAFGNTPGSKFSEGALNSSGVLEPGIIDFLSSQPGEEGDPQIPWAYLNWILFDEQFKYVATGSGFDQVGDNEEFKVHIFTNLPVTQSGYLYIYVSNETSNIDVFFDNLQVTHVRGPILEETHYYPFGLMMAGISSKSMGKLQNRYKFNDGTELENKEFSDGSGLEWYATEFRSYDPQIGRLWQIDPLAELSEDWSPYVYALNNPILLNDPLGLTSDTAFDVLDEVVVTPPKRPQLTPASVQQPPICYNCNQPTPDPGIAAAARPLQSGDLVYTKEFWAFHRLFPKVVREHTDLEVFYQVYVLDKLENTVVEPYGFWQGLWTESPGKNIFGDDVRSPYITGTVDVGISKIGKIKNLFKVFKSGSKRKLRPLPALDATGKVHGLLPLLKDLRKYAPEELRLFLKDLRVSVRERIRKTVELGRDKAHGQRQAQEQQLLKSIEKLLDDL